MGTDMSKGLDHITDSIDPRTNELQWFTLLGLTPDRGKNNRAIRKGQDAAIQNALDQERIDSALALFDVGPQDAQSRQALGQVSADIGGAHAARDIRAAAGRDFGTSSGAVSGSRTDINSSRLGSKGETGGGLFAMLQAGKAARGQQALVGGAPEQVAKQQHAEKAALATFGDRAQFLTESDRSDVARQEIASDALLKNQQELEQQKHRDAMEEVRATARQARKTAGFKARPKRKEAERSFKHELGKIEARHTAATDLELTKGDIRANLADLDLRGDKELAQLKGQLSRRVTRLRTKGTAKTQAAAAEQRRELADLEHQLKLEETKAKQGGQFRNDKEIARIKAQIARRETMLRAGETRKTQGMKAHQRRKLANLEHSLNLVEIEAKQRGQFRNDKRLAKIKSDLTEAREQKDHVREIALNQARQDREMELLIARSKANLERDAARNQGVINRERLREARKQQAPARVDFSTRREIADTARQNLALMLGGDRIATNDKGETILSLKPEDLPAYNEIKDIAVTLMEQRHVPRALALAAAMDNFLVSTGRPRIYIPPVRAEETDTSFAGLLTQKIAKPFALYLPPTTTEQATPEREQLVLAALDRGIKRQVAMYLDDTTRDLAINIAGNPQAFLAEIERGLQAAGIPAAFRAEGGTNRLQLLEQGDLSSGFEQKLNDVYTNAVPE